MFRFRIPILLALVVVAALVPTTSPVVALEYDDIAEAGAHRIAIEALEAAGILTGTECDTGGFCPDEPLPRWVMAVWIVRALGEEEPPAVDATVFADVEGDVWWAGYVQRLAELGITKGCGVNPALYCPHQPVTRAQMASFLTRAFNLAGLVRAFELEGTSAIRFTDTEGNTHARDINLLAVSSITIGCATNPLRYCPARSVTRAEMATFLARVLKLVPTVEYLQDVDGQSLLHLVSQYTTYHPCCADRVTNIQLFADKVDGVIVRPGENFSLNRHVGERTVEKGFLQAGTLINGELVHTVGGGVSQFATTFYNAVFWGGYQDIAHKPHSRYFSRYPEGIEATLDWPGLDVIFRNTSSRNVLIRTEYTSTSLTVTFFGDNDGRVVIGEWKDRKGHMEVIADGGDQARVVTADVSRRINRTTPPKPLYRPNSQLRTDQTKYLQPAIDGWTVRISRTINQGGKQTVQLWGVQYSPLRAIIEVHPCVLVQSCETGSD